ncbi:Hsp20/alpha crystallin family protein [Pedobacter agri]|uniref:Hsp20/alpha crystallin family protein n=1 Tax=Pedobacter agri TaxID=454586 RepID=UPI00292EE116|nr:Hsp20/alpha crystallin family protein [Pedobacter agri]
MYNENRCHTGKECGPRGGKFGRHHHGRFAHHAHEMLGKGFRRVPANIEETDENYIIHLFAPALEKEFLKVVTKDDVLSIAYTPNEERDATQKFSRREYSNGAFERAFALNGKVLTESISAKYADGILKVTLPKNPETNVPAKDIAVN